MFFDAPSGGTCGQLFTNLMKLSITWPSWPDAGCVQMAKGEEQARDVGPKGSLWTWLRRLAYLNPPSPYARKVVVVAHEVGLADEIEILQFDPWADPPALVDAIPLCKFLPLVTEDGHLFVESGTIAEYLMARACQDLPTGMGRFDVLARAAVAHGMMDAAFISVIEKRRPQEKQWETWIDRQYRALVRTLPTIAVPPPGRFDLGDIALACTLAYLDFRVAQLSWRKMRDDFATWLDSVSDRPSMLASKP
jgi:glutathione S-transferase